jgi:hypothetical protein
MASSVQVLSYDRLLCSSLLITSSIVVPSNFQESAIVLVLVADGDEDDDRGWEGAPY